MITDVASGGNMKVYWACVLFCAQLTPVFGSDTSTIAVLDFENHSIFDADLNPHIAFETIAWIAGIINGVVKCAR